MLDILFIHISAQDINYQTLSVKHTAIEPPIWAAMLAKHCIINNIDCAILDCDALLLSIEDSVQQIGDYKPRIVCFVVYGQHPSASAQNMEGAISLATQLKLTYPNIQTLFVGGYVAALPLEVLKHDCVDMVCQNEGVYTVSQLCQANLNTEKHKVAGLGYKEYEGQPILNDYNPIVTQENLEIDLPGMAWDLLPSLDHYRTSGWHSWTNKAIKSPFSSLYTSLGCKFKCQFCMINIINRTQGLTSADNAVFRYWKPEFIIKEFDYLAQHGVRNIKIADEMFVLYPEHFLKLCKLIIERNYDFNIWAYSRIDTCKPEYLEILRKAGIRFLGLGIENPNQVLRKEVIKGGFKKIKITDVVKMIRDSGIYVSANYMFGLPFDTEETMQFTLDFAMDLNTEMVNFNPTMAFPGSPLYYKAQENGWKLPDRYAGYSYYSYYTQNLPTHHLNDKDVLAFRDYAWLRYHTNPTYTKLVKNIFGQESFDNLKATTQVKLRRKILGD